MYEQNRFRHEEYREPGEVAVELRAPDFTLKDENGNDVSLYEFKQDNCVILVFIRAVDDRFTRGLLEYLKDSTERFAHYNGRVLAVSYGSVEDNKKLVENRDMPFHILSDPDCSVIKRYEIYNQYDKLIGPAMFVIDTAGIIKYMYVGKNPQDIVEDQDIIATLQGFTQSQGRWPPETYGTDYGKESIERMKDRSKSLPIAAKQGTKPEDREERKHKGGFEGRSARHYEE